MTIVRRLQATNRLPLLLLFTVTTLLCIAMLAVRVHVTSRVTFVFLVWNTILALIPYLISTLLLLYHHRVNRWLLWLPFAAWLCFFPNAPYILTDLFHLKPRPGVPYWYDLALLLFFALNGLMVGYASMLDMQNIFSQRFNAATGWLVSIGTCLLSGFGIYLGRYLRWNSWDVISSPTALMQDIGDRMLSPMKYPHTYGVTLVFATFLVLGYVVLLYFAKAYVGQQARSAA